VRVGKKGQKRGRKVLLSLTTGFKSALARQRGQPALADFEGGARSSVVFLAQVTM
jgi:hypothetical protein